MGNTDTTNKSGEHQEPLPEQANSQNGDPAGTERDSTSGADSEKVLQITQSALDDLMGARAQRAKSAAIKELLTELGVEDASQLKTVFEAHKAAQEAKKSDLEKAQERIDDLQKKADVTRVAYEAQLIRSEIMLKAPSHDVPLDRLDALLRLMDISALSVKDGKVEGVETAIKATVSANPFLLFVEQEQKKGTPLTSRQTKTQRTPGQSEEPERRRLNPLAKL